MSKASKLKKAESVGSFVRLVGGAEASIMLVLLSNIGGNIKHILTSQQAVFQYTTFILSAIATLVASVKLALAENKNLGKVQNLAIAIAKLALAGVMTFGTIVFAPIVITALFFTLMAVDTALAIGKAVYFGIKYQFADTPEKTFFWKKFKKNAIGAAIGLALIIAFALTIAFSPAGMSAIAAIGMAGSIIAGSVVLFSIGKAIEQTFFQKKKSEAPQEKLDQENDLKPEDEQVKEKENSLTVEKTSELDQIPSTYKHLDVMLGIPAAGTVPLVTVPEEKGYFANSVTPKKDLGKVVDAINEHIVKIMDEEIRDKENGSLWSQTEKRENKIHALIFLKALLEINHQGLTEKGEIQIDNHSFEYLNKEDLIKQIDQHVTKTYPGVYQSFFKDVGTVESLFNQAYDLLRSNSSTPEKTPANHTEPSQVIEKENTPPLVQFTESHPTQIGTSPPSKKESTSHKETEINDPTPSPSQSL